MKFQELLDRAAQRYFEILKGQGVTAYIKQVLLRAYWIMFWQKRSMAS